MLQMNGDHVRHVRHLCKWTQAPSLQWFRVALGDDEKASGLNKIFAASAALWSNQGNARFERMLA
ncbi:hypothetical protein CWE06_08525 [Aliidiomarina haloalkalitolerans]|uniref:Uncharacterized protein n=1 Tax=Aliidiomarina haloalkalitolerans TaxID=859059 RepID=A0A432VT27_9GAMM|nr:hypothetical protein CWE06_08525 [Aliidiomarina haloalkalitolerans]